MPTPFSGIVTRSPRSRAGPPLFSFSEGGEDLVDDGDLLGRDDGFPSKPILLMRRVSRRKPSISLKSVNTVSKHCTSAALAAITILPRAANSSLPLG